jgi:25S rRNA (uracil2634-N3)-methyltransferase
VREIEADHIPRPAGLVRSVDARKLGAPTGGGKEIRTGFARRERKRPAWYQTQLATPDSHEPVGSRP